MPLIARSRIQLLMLTLTACFLAGCTSQSPASRQALVGNYVYKSQDPEGKASDHEWDRLTLQGDGKYDLVQGGPTKAKSEKTGFWTFTGGDPAQVMLDHAGYPALVKGGEVRLMIDYDTGIWYAKSK
jgi:hypothetical protein